MTDTEPTFVEKVDDLAQVMGLDVRELHELHKAVSRRVTRMRIPQAEAPQPQTPGTSVAPLPQIQSAGPPVGLCARSGKLLSGWAYVEQYIEKVITTRIGTRVMRRHLGTDVPDAQDAPGSQTVILQVFRSIAEALEKYVPWYALREITLADAGRDGAYLFLLTGTYYPNAHKGDFSVTEEKLARIIIERGAA
jgi:phage baseplate assembly protein W